ncbi:MAG: hypothetical protein QW320_09770 [Ignisphaera sp.]
MSKKGAVGKEEVVDFAPQTFQSVFGTGIRVTRLDEFINKNVVIVEFEVEEGREFSIAHILLETENGLVEARTASKVVIKQLKSIENLLAEGKKVRASVKKVKRYLTLAPPE